MKVKVTQGRPIQAVETIFNEFNFSPKSGEKVILKPNFVAPRESNTGVTTDLQLISAVIEQIQKTGATPILAEGVGYEFTPKNFEILGIPKLVKKYGIEFVDLREAETIPIKTREPHFHRINIPKIIFESDHTINLPKLKTHMLTGISCAMKNLIGCLPLEERRKMHVYGLSKSIPSINRIIKTDLTIVDAQKIMHGMGPAFGDQIDLGLIIGGTDNLIIDDFCSKLLGVQGKISYIPKNVPEYDVDGTFNQINIDLPDNEFYRNKYWALYFVDHLLSKITRSTIIPKIITKIGTRPFLDMSACTKCMKCEAVCPVNAFDINNGVLDYKKCRYIRCMRCYDVCPANAIKIKGISKPTKEKEKK